MKTKSLVPCAAFLRPFCSLVEVTLSPSDSYFLSEIILVNNFHMFGRHVIGRYLLGIVPLLRSF